LKLKAAFFIAIFAIGAVAAEKPLIYSARPIGSEWGFNPLSYYLNYAFDTSQNPYYFSQSGFFSNHGKLWERIKSPASAIEREGGLGSLLGNEVVGFRALPNYTLHLLGGGYDYRWLAEWYEAHDVPYPYLFAFLNAYLANIGNEALETSAAAVNSSDHIADLFFFDIVGKLLFSWDPAAKFFHDTLHMRGWHFQPMFNLPQLRIDNAGANYIFRPYLFGDRIRPFFHVGMSLMGGVSFRVEGEDSLTVAAGVAPTDPLYFRGDPMVAIFWDRRDALLASITFNGSSALIFRLNVYPDFIDTGTLRTGVFVAYGKNHEVLMGLNISLPAGVSASF